jgi:hypothetical protein
MRIYGLEINSMCEQGINLWYGIQYYTLHTSGTNIITHIYI